MSDQPVPGSERRASVRYPCEVDVACHTPAVPTAAWSARVRDISVTGLGVVVNHPFSTGESLAVEFQSEDESLSYTLLGIVVHARALGDTEWFLGCAFARPLSEQELNNLL